MHGNVLQMGPALVNAPVYHLCPLVDFYRVDHSRLSTGGPIPDFTVCVSNCAWRWVNPPVDPADGLSGQRARRGLGSVPGLVDYSTVFIRGPL